MRRAPTRQCNRFFGAALLYTRGVFRYERSSMADPTIAHPGMALAETETKDPTIAHPEGERKAAAKQGQRARAGAEKRPWERKGERESDLDCKAAKKQRAAEIASIEAREFRVFEMMAASILIIADFIRERRAKRVLN